MNKADLIKTEEKKGPKRTIDLVQAGLSKRYRAEGRFKLYGLAAIILSLLCLAVLFVSIVGSGYTAFQQTFIELEVFFDPTVLGQEN
jgi:phosphate transport system permease protein